jgi:hypothetical protein
MFFSYCNLQDYPPNFETSEDFYGRNTLDFAETNVKQKSFGLEKLKHLHSEFIWFLLAY